MVDRGGEIVTAADGARCSKHEGAEEEFIDPPRDVEGSALLVEAGLKRCEVVVGEFDAVEGGDLARCGVEECRHGELDTGQCRDVIEIERG